MEKSVLEAIRDYRASMDDADYQRDVNDAVDAFQNGVSGRVMLITRR